MVLLFPTAHPKLPVIIGTIATTANGIKLIPILTACDPESCRRMLRCPITAPMRGHLDLRHAAVGFRKQNRLATISGRAKIRYPWPETSPDTDSGRWGCLETSARSRSIGRDVAFFEVAPIPRPGAGSTDRDWGCRDFGEAEGRTSGDAMWRWRWATTLLYTSVCTRDRHHAGAGRSGRRRARGTDRVSTWGVSSPLLRFRRKSTPSWTEEGRGGKSDGEVTFAYLPQ